MKEIVPRSNAFIRLKLLAFLTVLILPGAAEAQKLYKCQKDGKVVFSNKPCTGAVGSVQSSSPLQSKVTTLAGPAPGRAYSPEDKELLAKIQKEFVTLTAQCEAGDNQICDLLDCVMKADRAACARAEGRMEGNGWREVSRRENKLRIHDPQEGLVASKELEIVIECLPARSIHSVFWRGEGWVYLRDGEVIGDPDAGGEVRGSGSRFTTVEAAAEAACGVKRTEEGSPKPEDGSQ